ncbi:hypothetical protein QO034_06410 [Sedimentitalea sp. JM2-8]|uniref:Uncharacterized protein n=1 Tax=Sedimentitalea xiamensis TaxID=3050037 RepID=A0ABT7FC94_9RHOB|nr:hypothetical protein [Sedimentitalea xiamensis]MDK3072736.1 hypothetical protein [Sedimentitalea xiamensis]
MARYKLPAYPRSEREARARVNRKLKALRNRAFDLLTDSAGMFEEGIVSGSIDMLFEDIERGIASVKEAMDEEVERADEREREGEEL